AAPQAAAPQAAAPQAAAPQAAAPQPVGDALDAVVAQGPVAAMDPATAQADIDAYMRAQKARKARKATIYTVVTLLFVAVVGFFSYRSSQQEAARQEAARFLKAFNDVDMGSAAGFWRCVVRAKHKDIHLMDPALVVDGLSNVFASRPKSQPDYVKRKCLPMLIGVQGELDKLKVPEDFAPALQALKTQLPPLKTAFDSYVKKMELAGATALAEKEICAANEAFHAAEQTDSAKTVGYVNLLSCVMPDLAKKVRGLKQPPDVQPVVEFFQAEIKKDVVALADKLRKECYPQLTTLSRIKQHQMLFKTMSGDMRDGSALKYIFKRANRGIFKTSLDAIGKAFTDYRNGVIKVRQVADKFKKTKD
ncbi:MAG: hypothetical protein JRH20_31785, partial [Deltaproteobacteria bacterium]|nr:hypothetical protein [Deltaproteobacteria bacterium]